MTKEQETEYLESGGVACLFCKSSDIEGDSVEIESGVATQEIRCLSCGEEWIDRYRLVGVYAPQVDAIAV